MTTVGLWVVLVSVGTVLLVHGLSHENVWPGIPIAVAGVACLVAAALVAA